MTWAIPTPVFLELHVALSLLGILTGFIVVFGMLNGRHLAIWSAVFLATTFLTGVTGFPLAPFGIDPPRIIGGLLICLLIAAGSALYFFALTGAARSVYVFCSVAALYLNVFVAIVQAFRKVGALHALAPTQSEPPFAVAQILVLAVFVALGFLAWRRLQSPLTSIAAHA
jgi:hypothetical protein